MRFLFTFFILLISLFSKAQSVEFPKDWLGVWKGELQWFKNGIAEPQLVPMELHLSNTGKVDTYQWKIVYGEDDSDIRPYTLFPVNKETGHWKIDENNGIVLDLYGMGPQLISSFSIYTNQIINTYQLGKEEIHVSFYTLPISATNTTGKGTEQSPSVSNFAPKSFQKAILYRQK